MHEHPSYITDSSKRFINQFNQQVKVIGELCQSQKANPEFFNRSRKAPGFLNVLNDVLSGLGYQEICDKVIPALNHNRELPLEQFAKGISCLKMDQLKSLCRLKNIVVDDQLDQFEHSDSIRILTTALNGSENSKSDIAEAGRLIITLSSLAEEFIQLQSVLETFEPQLEGYEEACVELEQSPKNQSDWLKAEQAMESINQLLEQLDLNRYPNQLSKGLKAHLLRIKLNLLKTIIEHSIHYKDLPGNQIHIMQRNLSTWLEYEKLCQENIEKPKESDLEFKEHFETFKSRIQHKLYLIKTLIDEIHTSMRAKVKVSSYFVDVLTDLDSIIHKILNMNISMDRKFRVDLRQIVHDVTNTKLSLSNRVQKDQKELKQFPDLVKNPIQYFNAEVPHVMMRANPKEIKYMTLAFESSYKNINHQLKQSIEKLVDHHDFSRISEMIRLRYCDILSKTTGILGSIQLKAEERVA